MKDEIDKLLERAKLMEPVLCAGRERYVAEISFKAGQEDVMLDSKMGTFTVSSLVSRGRKEVVDWIEKAQGHLTAFSPEDRLSHYCPNCDHTITGVTEYEWQIKLKEWGMGDRMMIENEDYYWKRKVEVSNSMKESYRRINANKRQTN